MQERTFNCLLPSVNVVSRGVRGDSALHVIEASTEEPQSFEGHSDQVNTAINKVAFRVGASEPLTTEAINQTTIHPASLLFMEYNV